jgi:hypothetical protein
MTLYSDDSARFEAGLAALEGGYEISPENRFVGSGSIVLERIQG